MVVYYGGKAVEQEYFSRTTLGESIPSAYRDFYSKVHSSWGDITVENGRIDWPIESGSAQMCLDENQLHWVPVFDFFTLNPDIRAGFDLSNVSNGTAASFYIDDFRSGEYTNLPLLDGQATNELAALVEVTLVHGLDAFDTRA